MGFPKLYSGPETPDQNFVVMQLLGVDLARIRRAMPDKKFALIMYNNKILSFRLPMTDIMKIASQTLKLIKSLHISGWINRDVKLGNFCVGLEDIDQIYMIDHNFARRFMYDTINNFENVTRISGMLKDAVFKSENLFQLRLSAHRLLRH